MPIETDANREITGKVNALLNDKYQGMPFGLRVAVVDCVSVLEEMGVADKVYFTNEKATEIAVEGLAVLIWNIMGNIDMLQVINHPMVASIGGKFIAREIVAPGLKNITEEKVLAMEKDIPAEIQHYIDQNWKT